MPASSETVANFVLPVLRKIKDTNTLTNNHANQYRLLIAFSKMIFGESNGYTEFIWANHMLIL